jgi:hypothetical protein
MKIAVINFSGNVGKTTVARHLLLPRIAGAELVAVESLNAAEGEAPALRGRQFGELQEYLQTVEHVVVDIGASNVEDLMGLMHKYRGSHEDFDCFVVPTVAAFKQQQDTIATLAELAQLGVPASRLKLVFNMVEDGVDVAQAFETVLAFLAQQPIAQANLACRLGLNEIYERVKASGKSTRGSGHGVDLAALAMDATDYKALIVQASSAAQKVALAQRLATRRLACGVLPELDACFAALGLKAPTGAQPQDEGTSS